MVTIKEFPDSFVINLLLMWYSFLLKWRQKTAQQGKEDIQVTTKTKPVNIRRFRYA